MKKKKKKHLQAVFFSEAWPVSGQDIKWDSLRTDGHICAADTKAQANCILRKTHPDILFCLFGLVRMVAKHSSAHTAVETDMESLTTNLHVEEIPYFCSSPPLVNEREVYYHGEDVYCQNIIRYFTKHL